MKETLVKDRRIFLCSYRKATEARSVAGSHCTEALRGRCVKPGLHGMLETPES